MPRQQQRAEKQQSRQRVWTEALAKMLYQDAVEDKYEGTGGLFPGPEDSGGWGNICDVKYEDGLLHITIEIDSVMHDGKSWKRILTLKPVDWQRVPAQRDGG